MTMYQGLKVIVASCVIMLGLLVTGQVHAQTINSRVAICSVANPVNCAVPTAGGALPITGTISASSSEHSTAAAPSYVEGTDNPLSGDLGGALRVNCTVGCSGAGNSNAQATTAAPSYSNNTSNALSMDLAGNLRVIVGNASIPVSGSVTVSGTVGVSSLPALVAGSAIIGKVGIDQTTPGTTNGVQVLTGSTTAVTQATAANLNATVVNAAGSAIIGKVGIDQTTPGTTNGVQVNAALPVGANTIGNVNAIQSGTWNTGTLPLAAVGTSNFHLIAAATNNSTLVSTGAHAVFEATTGNNSANIAYLKIFDKATAPTCGTDTPVAVYIIPGATAGGAGSNVNISLGKAVTLGLGICVTGGIADNDNTSVAASAYAVNLTYK